MSAKKVLIVDYDVKGLDITADLFKSHKLEVLKATDGKTAYEKYKSEKPDLIILEPMLPKMHGFNLAQKIYEETKGSIPIIIVTAIYKARKFRDEAFNSYGVVDYHEKPYDSGKLVRTVLDLLHEKIDIEEVLPSPEEVRNLLVKLDKKKPPPPKKS